jgi:hypothetical protein
MKMFQIADICDAHRIFVIHITLFTICYLLYVLNYIFNYIFFNLILRLISIIIIFIINQFIIITLIPILLFNMLFKCTKILQGFASSPFLKPPPPIKKIQPPLPPPKINKNITIQDKSNSNKNYIN